MDLNTLWFILLGVLLAGYAILDGFDLGVGIMHPRARTDLERRILMNSIGPLWDGNEVWLVTFGGALFAAFPHAYATAFSGYYLPFMLLLFALIFRAVSMEFRSKHDSPALGARSSTTPSAPPARLRPCSSAWPSATQCSGYRSAKTASTPAGSSTF